jgi:polysaccharide biosynthesis/export protein
MKRFYLYFAHLCILASQAQDPGFKPLQVAPTTTPPAAVDSNSAVPQNVIPLTQGAGVITSMSVLDNTQIIGYGDVISVRILEDKQPASQMRVGATGQINTPMGLITAAGKTCKSLAYAMKSQLEESLYKKATVIIAIDQVHVGNEKPKTSLEELDIVTVFGQVLRQGRYELSKVDDDTISRILIRAGGFAQFANTKKIKLIRKTPSGSKTILINIDKVMREGLSEYDVFLRNGDVIIVSEKTVSF